MQAVKDFHMPGFTEVPTRFLRQLGSWSRTRSRILNLGAWELVPSLYTERLRCKSSLLLRLLDGGSWFRNIALLKWIYDIYLR